MGAKLKDAIKEAMFAINGEATTEQIKNFVTANYPNRWKYVGACINDLTYPGCKSSTFPPEERFLEKIEHGKYRLRVQAAIPKEIFFLWRRDEGGNIYGELLGVFSEANLAIEKIRGKNHLEYHVESWPLNKFEPSKGEILFYLLGCDKNGLIT